MTMKSLLIFLLPSLLFAVSPARAEPVKPEAVVATFGDVPIHAEEMAFHIRDQVALVAVHFKSRHQVDLTNESWLQEIGGEIPVEMLKARAVHACRISKAIQALAMESGVAGKLPFPGFARACEKLNRTRAEARAEGRILYGLVEYAPAQLYKYKLTNMRNHLRDRDLTEDYDRREADVQAAIATKMAAMPPKPESEGLRLLVAQQVGAR